MNSVAAGGTSDPAIRTHAFRIVLA
jgi:hypothetical protein